MIGENIPHQDITYKIIGAAMKVHNSTPRGLKEIHYQRALSIQMEQDGLCNQEEHHVQVYDGDICLGNLYLDHFINGCVVVEDKAFAHPLGDTELAQVITYLAATKAKVGLLINFGRRRLEYKRILPPKTLDGWQEKIQPYLL
jgi:GxxExxY protein